jgi:photosystem II stability/assembly factor-like uncharacterized protein
MHLGSRVACVRIVAAVSLFGGLAGTASAGHYSWTTAGPEAGYIFQIVVSPQDSTVLRASAGFNGPMLFQSTDRGQSWTEEGSVLFNGRLAAHPSDGNRFYTLGFADGQSGVLKTIDGGATWVASNSGLPATPSPSFLALAPAAPETLYAAFGGNPGQVFRTTDGAASWTLVSSAFPSYYVVDLAVDPQDSAVLYAASSGPDVIKSVDGGATWSGTGLNLDTTRIVVDRSNPSIVFAATSHAGVYRSSDAGATWAPANGGIADSYVKDLTQDPSDPSKLWAGVELVGSSPGGLFVTSNGGANWSPVDLGESVNIVTAVAVDPRNSSFLYVAASASVLRGGFFQSSDAGSHWSRTEKGLSGYYAYAVAPDPAQGSGAYGVSGSRVYRTDDRGSDWALRGTAPYGITTLVADPSSTTTLYAGFVSPTGSGDGALKSVDGGATWNPATNGLATSHLYRLAIAPAAPDHLLAPTLEGLFETVDGGGLWSPLLAGDVHAAAADSVDVSILYAGFSIVGPGSGVLRSPDGGATWLTPGGIPAGNLRVNDFAVPAADPSRVYAAAANGILRSVDRGLNFSPANTGLPPMPGIVPFRLAPDPAQAGTVYLLAALGGTAAPSVPDATFPGNVFRTTNGADSWTQLPGFLPAFATVDFSVSATGRTLYAATTSGVFQFERSFLDVPDTDPFWPWVDAAAMNGVTAGCGSGSFCPDLPTSRASIAVFLLRGKNGVGYAPPPATGTVFGDVPASAFAAGFIEELSVQGITAGCGGGNYCPDAALTRAEVAVLLLKTKHGSNFVPPPATGMVFNDVPAGAFAADWIERLALEGVTAGCGGGDFCPDAPVSRAQAAAFVVLAFGLS